MAAEQNRIQVSHMAGWQGHEHRTSIGCHLGCTSAGSWSQKRNQVPVLNFHFLFWICTEWESEINMHTEKETKADRREWASTCWCSPPMFTMAKGGWPEAESQELRPDLPTGSRKPTTLRYHYWCSESTWAGSLGRHWPHTDMEAEPAGCLLGPVSAPQTIFILIIWILLTQATLKNFTN